MTKAIILAAGRGSRMKKLTIESPKCLLKVRGKTLLQHQVDSLNNAGLFDVGIVTGYKSNSLPINDMTEFHNVNWESTQMVESLMCADSWLRESECLVSYSDIFYESNAVKLLLNCHDDIAITYDIDWFANWSRRFDNPCEDAESLKIDSFGFLREIGRSIESAKQADGQFMGLLKFTPNGWRILKGVYLGLNEDDRSKIHLTALLDKVVASEACKVKAVPFSGVWGEIDSPRDLEVFS